MNVYTLLWLLAPLQPPAQQITVSFTVPNLKVSPYHRPYLAIWLEDLDRNGVHTLAVWHEDEKWLKDIRQWWRKLGRSSQYDAVSGATRKPGAYSVSWNGKDASGKPPSPGEYYLNIEATREEGGRDFLRQKIKLDGETQTYVLEGDLELGKVEIQINGGN